MFRRSLKVSYTKYKPQNTFNIRGYLSGTDFIKSHPSPNDRPINVLFFGSSDVAIPTLIELNKARKAGYNGSELPIIGNLEVVVPPLRTKHLKMKESDVETCAESLGLTVHRIPPEIKFKMVDYQMPPGDFDLGVVISFGYMIRPDIINSFPMSMINAHASLLPLLKGAAPIQYAMINNLPETGVSITTLHPTSIDSGRILHQASFPIEHTDNFTSVAKKIGDVAGREVLYVIKNWDELGSISREQGQIIEEDSVEVPPHLRLAPKIKKGDAIIDFTTQTAVQVAGRCQGLTGFISPYTQFKNKRLELINVATLSHQQVEEYNARLDGKNPPLPTTPGHFIYCNHFKALVTCASDGEYVTIERVKLECKKESSAFDFHNGHFSRLKLPGGEFESVSS